MVSSDLRVKDEEGNAKKEIFYSEEGLKEFVRYVDSSREHFMNDVISVSYTHLPARGSHCVGQSRADRKRDALGLCTGGLR